MPYGFSSGAGVFPHRDDDQAAGAIALKVWWVATRIANQPITHFTKTVFTACPPRPQE